MTPTYEGLSISRRSGLSDGHKRMCLVRLRSEKPLKTESSVIRPYCVYAEIPVTKDAFKIMPDFRSIIRRPIAKMHVAVDVMLWFTLCWLALSLEFVEKLSVSLLGRLNLWPLTHVFIPSGKYRGINTQVLYAVPCCLTSARVVEITVTRLVTFCLFQRHALDSFESYILFFGTMGTYIVFGI